MHFVYIYIYICILTQWRRNTCDIIKETTFNTKGWVFETSGQVHLGSSVSSNENDINMRPAKAWTVIDRLSVIWKSDLTDKIKRNFFPSSSLVDTAIWMLNKHMEKKLDGNYTRMLRAVFIKSWRQQSTKQQLYGHLPPITRTIQVRWNGHEGHCWRRNS